MSRIYKKLGYVASFIFAVLLFFVVSNRVEASTYVSQSKRTELATSKYYYVVDYVEGEVNPWVLTYVNESRTVSYPSSSYLINAIDSHRVDAYTYEYHDCLIKFKSFVVKEELWFTKGTYYITAYDGDIFLKGRGEGTSHYVEDTYYDVTSSGFYIHYGAIVYFYDCTVESVEHFSVKYSNSNGRESELFLDNVNFNLASGVGDIDSTGNHMYVEPKDIDVGSKDISNMINIVNGTKLDIANMKYCPKNGSTCNDGVGYEREIDTYGNFFIEDSTINYTSIYFNYLYGTVQFESNITLLGNVNEPLPYISNSGKVIFRDEPVYKSVIDGTTIIDGVTFRIFNESADSIVEVYGFGASSTARYEIQGYEVIYNYDGARFLVGDSTSVSRFEAVLPSLTEVVGSTTVAYADQRQIANNLTELVIRYRYFKVFVYSEWNSKSVYIPIGKTLNENYNEIVFEDADFFPDEYKDDFYLAGYKYCYNVTNQTISCSTFDDIDDLIVDHNDGSINFDVRYVTYNINFDEDSMLGATVDIRQTTFLTRESIGSNLTLYNVTNRPSTNEYIFKGWSFTKDGELIKDGVIAITEENYKNLTVYAVYNPVYVIEYWSLGKVVYTGYKESGTVLEASQYSVPEKEGYTFQYWYDKSSSTIVEYEFGQVITGYLALEAKYTRWYKITFTLDYSYEDVVWENDTNKIFADGSETYIVQEDELVEYFPGNIVPVREDYKVTGWFYMDTPNSKTYEFGNYPTGNLVLYPIWSIKTYNIRFHRPSNIENIENWPSDYVVEKYTKIYEPSIKPSATDYTFQLWYYEVVPGTLAIYYWGYEVKEDVDLHPYFYANEYDISYQLDVIDNVTPILGDGYRVSISADDKGKTIVLPTEENFSKLPNNYALVGWSRVEGADRSEALTSIVITGAEYRNLKLYPVWVIKHKVHFVANEAMGWEHEDTFELLPEGTMEYIVQVIDGGKVERIKYIPFSLTHTFMYWGIENGSGELIPFDYDTIIEEDLYLYAHWDAIVLAIKFEHTVGLDEDATPWPSNYTINAGEKVVEPTAPELYGYTFLGWYRYGYEYAFDFKYELYSPVTLVAKWELTEYVISYSMSDGSNVELEGNYVSSVTIDDIGTAIILPAQHHVKLHKKYEFIGWTVKDSSAIVTTYEITKDNVDELEFVLIVNLKSIEINILLLGEYYTGTTNVKWKLEAEDKWGVKNYLNGAVYDNNATVATYILDSEDDTYTLPNVNDVFVTNNYMAVSGWLVDFKEVAPGFTITYDNAWNYMDSEGIVTIDPIFVEHTYYVDLTNSAYDEEWQKNYSDDVYINASYEVGAADDGQSFFVFEVKNGDYTLVKKANIRNAIIPGSQLGVGYHDLVAFWISGVIDNFDEVDSYDDLLGYEKYKLETHITIVKRVIELSELPVYVYLGIYQCVTVADLGSDGIEVDCESQIDAGTYTYTVRLTDKEGSTWVDGTTDDKELSWTIERLVVYHRGDLSNNNRIETFYTYQKGTTYQVRIEDVVQQDIFDSSAYVFEGDYIVSDAGIYSFRVTFVKNYTFLVSDGSDRTVYTDFTWEIKKSYSVLKPTMVDPYKFTRQFKANEVGQTLFTINDFYYGISVNQVIGLVEIKGDVSYTALGTYQVIVAIKEKNNYGWAADQGYYPGFGYGGGVVGGMTSDEETNSDDYVYEWRVDPLYIPVPRVICQDWGSYYLFAGHEIIYDLLIPAWLEYQNGMPHQFRLEFSDEEFRDYVEIIGDISAINVGEYQFTLRLKDKTTSSWHTGYPDTPYVMKTDDIVIRWSINPRSLSDTINIYIEDGKLIIDTHGITQEAVITFRNMTIDPNMTPSTTIELVEGENFIEYYIDYVDDNYMDSEGGMGVYYDGSPLEDDDNDDDNPPVDEDDNDDTSSSSKSSSGCSMGRNGKSTRYGDLLACMLVFGFVFFRKKYTL